MLLSEIALDTGQTRTASLVGTVWLPESPASSRFTIYGQGILQIAGAFPRFFQSDFITCFEVAFFDDI